MTTKEENLRKCIAKKYPIAIYFLADTEAKQGGYYYAYLLDFGSGCSAIGETAEQALRNLRRVQKVVLDIYARMGKSLPKPSPIHWERHLSRKGS
jgi:predicted RNase H-like HicB family nuclease